VDPQRLDAHPPARICAYADAQWQRAAVKEFVGQERPAFRPVAP